MLCEPKEDHGWECLVRKDGKWVSFGEFNQIVINDKKVNLPVTGGKVQFDREGCVKEEDTLHCSKEQDI